MKSNPIASTPNFLLSLVASFLLWGGSAQAALNAYMRLTLNGTAVTGEVSVNQLGGVDVSSDHIECHAVNLELIGGGTSRLQATPLKIVKRIDQSTPLLARALSRNEVVQGTLRYFRLNTDTGETEEYFNIVIDAGRVSSVRHWTPNNLDPAASQYPFMEEVSFTFQRLTFKDLIFGAEHEIDLGAPL